MAKVAPNFLRLDTPVAKSELIVWASDDYVGEFPYTIFNALGYPVGRGNIKAKSNRIPIDSGSSAGIYALVIGNRAFTVVKTGE